MSIAEKLQTIADNTQKVYNAGYEKGKSEGGGGEDLNAVLTEQEELVAELKSVIAQKAAGGGGGELPTLFTPTIALQNANEVSITDENGGFVEKYEVYIDGVKSGEVTSKSIIISNITTSTKTLQIFVKAFANLFNASEASNIVSRKATEGTVGLSYAYQGSYYRCTGIGSATDTDIVIPAKYSGWAVREVKDYAFQNNTNITSVEFADVQTIGYAAFSGCTKLAEITHYGSLISIAGHAFSNCYALGCIDLTAYGADEAFPSLGNSYVFLNCGRDTTKGTFEIRVPSGRKAELSSMTNWSTYADNIVEVN